MPRLLSVLVFSAALEYRDVPAAVFDNALALQFARGLGDPFATYAEHVGDQFSGHVQLIARQTIQRQ